MKGNAPPSTVIKLPIGLTESNVSKQIRLRNNIRLNLPPDRYPLLQTTSLCFLCLLSLLYSIYLHYLLFSHVTSQIATNRFYSGEIGKLTQTNRMCSVEIGKLKQALEYEQAFHQRPDVADSELGSPRRVDDLKASLQAFITSLQILQSKKDDYSDETKSDRDRDSSYKEEDVPEIGGNSNELAILSSKSYGDMHLRDGQNSTNYMPRKELEDVVSQNSVITEATRAFQSSGLVAAGAILPNNEEVILILPRDELLEKRRRARDVSSLTTTPLNQAKGKKKRKQHRASKYGGSTTERTRSHGRKFVSILLKGATPTASIRDGGVIRPWYLDTRAIGNSNTDVNSHFVLQELNGKIQIMKSGLYMIYAQIYYTSSDLVANLSDTLNSYSITVSHPSSAERAIAVCSVHSGATHTSEVSCHLSIVYHLGMGDKLYLVQREPNRKILLKDGYSYFGVSALRVDS